MGLSAGIGCSHIASSVTPVGGGSVIYSGSGTGYYADSTDATLFAQPNPGYSFVCWTEGADTVSTEVTYSFVAGGDRELVAHFKLKDAINIIVAFAIQVYPNPTSGKLYVKSVKGNMRQIMICDITGQVVYQKRVEPEKLLIEVDMNRMSKGVNLVKIESEEDIRIERVIKQ